MARIKVNMDEIPDFQMPEAGKHRSKLVDCEKEISQAGNDMLVWKWEVTEGDSEGRTINSYTSLLDDALGGLKTHLKAFGFDGEVDVDTDKLIGKKATLVVVKRKYRDRDTGEEKESSSVANVLPDSKAAASKPKVSAVVQESDDDIPF